MTEYVKLLHFSMRFSPWFPKNEIIPLLSPARKILTTHRYNSPTSFLFVRTLKKQINSFQQKREALQGKVEHLFRKAFEWHVSLVKEKSELCNLGNRLTTKNLWFLYVTHFSLRFSQINVLFSSTSRRNIKELQLKRCCQAFICWKNHLCFTKPRCFSDD